MGADLISYICVGPKNLKASLKPKAIKHIRKCLADKTFMSFQYDCHDDFVDAFLVKPEQLVDDLFDVWHRGARDSASRPVVLVNNARKRNPQTIVVAGELSWGDSPDGFGYQTLMWADNFGLFEIFDIK